MKLSNVFKKRKKEKKPKKIEKPKEKLEEERVEKRSPVPSPKPKRKETGVAPLVLKSPQITEKATNLARDNQYLFKVFPRATKQEIKKAVEGVYGVGVLRVRTVRVPKKQRRLGRNVGWRKAYKKAIVTLRKGQKIEVLPR